VQVEAEAAQRKQAELSMREAAIQSIRAKKAAQEAHKKEVEASLRAKLLQAREEKEAKEVEKAKWERWQPEQPPVSGLRLPWQSSQQPENASSGCDGSAVMVTASLPPLSCDEASDLERQERQTQQQAAPARVSRREQLRIESRAGPSKQLEQSKIKSLVVMREV
jgi:hypothetical protein